MDADRASVAGDFASPVEDGLDRPVPREHNPMLDPANRLKLALFCANVARGTSMSFAPSLPKGQWEESARLAKRADAAGIDGYIPLGRWKHNSRSRPQDDRFVESFTGAAALAAVTNRISLFATVHVPLFHPVVVAGMASTIDHVSGGRFSINVVAGWSAEELSMFGVGLRPHDERYEYADEWMELLKRTWTAEEVFDFHGRFLDATGVLSKPLPLQRPYPAIMSAGSSPAGRRFAAQHADINFVHLPSFEEMRPTIAAAKDDARTASGRDPGIFAGGYIVCADTEKEAWRRYHHVVRDQLDVASASEFIEMFNRQAQSALVVAERERIDRMAAGFNAMTLVGTAEQIVERMQQMSDAGLAGLAISFDDYDEGLAAYDEAIRPLLIQAGLRVV
jgi:alkanesulfonate monooxygenase SsuD/methylene tetrahydromethanopterin reductase-like flavin-dependent oxidoreductase (luciferase family)